MTAQIKRAIKAGNSSAVILPRAWLNKEIRVELVRKSKEDILIDTLNIIKSYIDLKSIIGVYLSGSYARGDEDEDSDIDVLVVTNNVDKELVKKDIYSILIISSEQIKLKLKNDLLPIGQMVKEASVLLNSDYLNSLEVKPTKKNLNWHIKTTQEKLKLIKKIIKGMEKRSIDRVNDKVVYTLILRIRTLYIIQRLIENKKYSKRDFLNLILKLSGKDAYESYLRVKDDKKVKDIILLEDVKNLCNYLEKQLTEIKGKLQQ